MKKIILSLAVILGFGAYAVALHHPDDESHVVIPPSLKPTDTQSPTPQTMPTASDAPSVTTATPTATPTPAGKYKDGAYTGTIEDALYGNVQVKVTVKSGAITDVQFLDYPHDRGTSVSINSQATPYLRTEAIQAQSANVDIVSGATQTSLAFQRSLSAALQQAQ